MGLKASLDVQTVVATMVLLFIPYKQLRKRKEVIIVSHCISDFFPFTVQVDIFFGDNLFCGISLVDLFIHFDDVQGIVSFQLTLKKHTSVSITV